MKSAVVIELSPLVYRMAQVLVDTFHDFALFLYRQIEDNSEIYGRVDVVCDRYFKDSLKQQTRTSRGVGTKVNFTDQTPFPTESFL